MNSNEVNKIICGDCMETMRGMGNKSVDLIVTDVCGNAFYKWIK